MRKLKPLLPYFRPYRRYLVGGILSILATASIALLAPLVVGRAIDSLKDGVEGSSLLAYGALLVGIALVQGVFQLAQRQILVTMSRHIEFDLRNDFFRHLERLEPAFYQRHYTGDLMARATNDLSAVRMLCGPAIMYSTNTVFTGTGAILFMLHIHAGLTAVALATVPLTAVVTRIFGQRIHLLFERVQEHFATLSAKVQENLAGARVVRAYVQESAEAESYARLNREYVDRARRLIRWAAAFHPLLQGVVGIGFAAVLWYGGHLLLAGTLTVGQFVTFNLFLGKLIWPMIAIGWVINLAQRGAASFGRMREVLDTPPAIVDEEPLAPVGELTGAVRFTDLSFTYPGVERPTLRGIDLSVPAGTTVAVVGRTGSGKSTLLSLIPRLVDPPPGTLAIDGVDLRRLPLATLRRSIAMVPQETYLFSATIADNIAFGRPDAGEVAVHRAARLAGLEKDLESFPKGLQTVVGERGITLSGGQKQRVALARALLSEPPILLLDDCLSAVDAETEERILKNLRTVFPGRTVFQVSHRISAVKTAQLIVVLDQGEIRERGTHTDLLAAGGLYADLVQRQRLEEELAAV